MFVITDEETFRICGKCCLTCSGKTEEDSCVLTVHICVRGAVHRSDALQRQIVVHHREHTFLHLSAVPCIDDNLLTAGDVEGNSCLGVQAQFFIVLNFCFGSIVNDEIRLEIFQFFLCRDDEHVLYKMCLPCYFHDETDSHTGIFVSAAECVNYEQSLVGQLFLCNIF